VATEIGVLKCSEVSELVTDYMEGELPARRWLAVRFHLFMCGMCRAYLDQIRKARQLLLLRALDGPPEAVEQALLEAARQAPKPAGE
jgi:anti-sigma factor RsiW